MKKRFSFYLYAFLASFSLMSQAMEPEQNRPELEALQKIAVLAFPSPIYERDRQSDDDKILEEAKKHVQDGTICAFPSEIYLDTLFPYIGTPLGAGIGMSCKFFYQLSQVSFLSLNPYCLKERMPHVIPINLLRFKTLNTEGGLLKLAALYSVSIEDLCGWFDPSFLQTAFLSCQGSLPEQLADQSDEVLGTLYPILKVSLAAIQAKDTDEKQKTQVMGLAQEFTNPYESGISLNKQWLLTLNPDRPGVFYQTLEQLFHRVQMPYSAISVDSPVLDIKCVIARELFMCGRQVANVNTQLVLHCFHKRDLATQVIELCLQYPQLIFHNDGENLIRSSLALVRPDLALRILSWVIDLPDDATTLTSKVHSLATYKDIKVEDEKIQSYFNQFTSNLYRDHWASISGYSKEQAFLLMMQAERRQDVSRAVDELLLVSEKEFLNQSIITLIEDLNKYCYPTEIKKLILRFLNIDPDMFISSFPYILDGFIDHAIKIDREKTVALLKGYVESENIHRSNGLAALVLLAKFAEKDYVLSKMDSLTDEQMGDDPEFDLSAIFYYLDNKERCHSYFQQAIIKHFVNKKTDSQEFEELLQDLQKQGHKITCLEDMQTMDPFEFFDVVSKNSTIGEARQAG